MSSYRERNADSPLPVSAADWQAGNHRSSSWVVVAFSLTYLQTYKNPRGEFRDGLFSYSSEQPEPEIYTVKQERRAPKHFKFIITPCFK